VTTPLPDAPSLEQLRRRAKDLLRDHRAGDPAAVARVAAHDPGAPLKLTGAQHVVAREHGFATWPRMKAYVERVEVHGPGLEHAYHEDLDYYEGRAGGLLASAQDGTPGAVEAFESARAPLTAAGARAVVARRHGFESWAALRRHVASLREGGEPFAAAYRALEAHDLAAVREQLDRFPVLVAARGTNGNDLLGMAGAAGDERIVALLLERGADPNAANAHGWTPLHQAAYSDRASLASALLDAGASPSTSARGDGGTPLVVALFWGNVTTADLLAERGGVQPRNLRAAAGLGDTELIAELLDSPEAGAHRGFYRPHGGFPAWTPSGDPQEVRDEALAWAARNDRTEAIDLLVARGADPDADVYRGTPLAWAAAVGRPRAIQRLVARGAGPNHRSSFGGPDHGGGVTPLHLAAQNGLREAIDALLAAGADPSVRDDLHGGTPADWAAHSGRAVTAERLRKAAGG
jgi:ankyrin repeat protein